RLTLDGDVALLLIGAVLIVLPFASSAAGLALLALTMRRSNGYRGLHEIVSGTETIRLPSRAPGPDVPDRSRSDVGPLPGGVPARLGGFAVRAVLRQGDGEMVLACEDEALRRPVWVWARRGEGATKTARRDLTRAARPRW